MALRISNTEKALIRQLNKKAQQKSNRLFKTYGVKKMKFNTMQVKDFKTRKQLNEYKQAINTYLKRATHRYTRGGLVAKGTKQYFYPIPTEELWEVRRLINKRNQAIARWNKRFETMNIDIKGKKQDETFKQIMASKTASRSQGLNFKYATYQKLKLDTSQISSRKTLRRFKYAVKNFQSKPSINRKQQIAFNNYLQALYNTFGSNARPLINVLKNLSVDEFMAFFESDEFAEFYDVYDISQANELLSNLAQHFLNFIDQNNINIDDNDQYILEQTLNLDSQRILMEYGKGEYGGTRVYLPHGTGEVDRYNTKTKTTYYIDLTPEESEMYEASGRDINTLYMIVGEANIQTRKKQLTTAKNVIRERK